MTKEPVFVTQPTLPPLDDFIPYLQSIWSSKILTNGGPMHQLLESALCEFLGVKHVVLFNNGTIALICALLALDLSGEVITTPYTFVATAHALLWNNLTPVFVDIEPDSPNLDPQKIEAAITDKTTAILPVHCYGRPCDVEAIQLIADRYKLRVIYDAAHAFGVQIEKGSLLNYGDLSILSFHATKVFNTFEGGAIICHSQEMKDKINSLKNFGIKDELSVNSLGINGKMNEVSAAFGLLQLQHIENAFCQRKHIALYYQEHFAHVPGLRLLESKDNQTSNYSYFPIWLEDVYPLSRDALYDRLKFNNIYSRRYFYPLVSEFSIYKDLLSASRKNLIMASRMSEQVLCLPIYSDLERTEQDRIIEIIKGVV